MFAYTNRPGPISACYVRRRIFWRVLRRRGFIGRGSFKGVEKVVCFYPSTDYRQAHLQQRLEYTCRLCNTPIASRLSICVEVFRPRMLIVLDCYTAGLSKLNFCDSATTRLCSAIFAAHHRAMLIGRSLIILYLSSQLSGLSLALCIFIFYLVLVEADSGSRRS